MLLRSVLFYLLFFHLVRGQLHINLYLTNWTSNDENKYDLQHDCLHAILFIQPYHVQNQIISYCLSKWPSKWNIQENNFDPKFSFADLSKQKVTSQQLYHWSAPLDVIENYQSYLDQLPNSEKISQVKEFFYNCTLPNFGPQCQYILNAYKPHHTSLTEILQDFYCSNGYEPATLTCYTHLQCNRGFSPSCLDWSEICDGKVDCLDDGYDEKYCWQLEIHQCDENEYRCSNGQCIPQKFVRDRDYFFDCLDQSDEPGLLDYPPLQEYGICPSPEPTFLTEDTSCIRFFDMHVNALTSSCVPERHLILLQAMFTVKPKLLSDECWTAFKCIIRVPILIDALCENLCFDGICDKIIKKTCPNIIHAPATPVLLGHVFLAYEKEHLQYHFPQVSQPIYICYNDQHLHLPDNTEVRILSNNNTCRFYNNSMLSRDINETGSIDTSLGVLNRWLQTWTSWIYNDSTLCNQSTMYQCINSYKCISKRRLFDRYQDCFHNDDEDISLWDKNCSANQDLKHFKCKTTNECIPLRFVKDDICHCTTYAVGVCDDESSDYNFPKATSMFPRICDNIIDLYDQNYTDETECDQWPCNNIYTRCDGFWNCLNGVDELNCDPVPLLKCPSNNHICVSIKTKNLTCLPIEKANDGIVDCIGAADEPTLCRANKHRNQSETFYCENDNHLSCIYSHYLCDTEPHCTNQEDESSCTNDDFKNYYVGGNICQVVYEPYSSDIVNVLCKVFYPDVERYKEKYLRLGEIKSSSKVNVKNANSDIFPNQPIYQTVQYHQPRCHRGLDIQVWVNKEKNLTTSACLCPPSFYGDVCQFQNQRVSVTVQFRPPSDSLQTLFVIIVSLIDDSEERIIHSYEQFTFMSAYHCFENKKFHAYLLYSTRPKNEGKNYSIHIDIYERISFIYRGSFIKPLLFPFLPIHRLSLLLNIPSVNENIESCSDHQCVNGQCQRSFNDPNNTMFCQCNPGWSGRYCTIKHTCTCSSDSLCLGKLANNRSLCVCPLNKIGDRCLLYYNACEINPDDKCLNNGKCISLNDYRTNDTLFICLCPKGFIGDRCEIPQTKIVVSFDKHIVVPFSIRIHFIVALNHYPHYHDTLFRTIPFGQTSTTIYRLYLFNLILLELPTKNYYLTFIEDTQILPAIIERTLYPSNHCLHISELFNKTILNYHPLHRIKFYHILCQTNTSPRLSCFVDDIHVCLCQDYDERRVANCFEFDYNISMNRADTNDCENGGECFQDVDICPVTIICVCPVCFYGTRCQLSTSGFSLSLDAILGYYIRPNVKISHQPAAVLISLILTVIITLGGIVNGVLSLMTFKHKKTRDVGCGIYLLHSSINTLLLMIIFTLKYFILLFSQMGSITNRSFLNVQCHSMDFLLRFCLTMDQWLTTCVAIERAYITIKGANSNKKKIRSKAKLVIVGLVLITIGTAIHDPISRRLFDDIDENKRTWCIVKYSTAIHIVDLVTTIFHIIVPFIINVISAIIIIIIKTRQRAVVQKKEKYQDILKKQFQQHKNLLIGPCVLISLGIPRLIIPFASGCMKSASDSWLFLLGYFISLIPPLLTFILFVLPSSTYSEVFRKAFSRYRNMIRMRS